MCSNCWDNGRTHCQRFDVHIGVVDFEIINDRQNVDVVNLIFVEKLKQ